MSDWFSDLVKIGTTLYGGYQTRKANKQAASTAAEGNAQATQAIRESNRVAQERLARLESAGQPGVQYLRTVIAEDPNMLTPAQQLQLDESRRQATNTLRNSGLSGSGRAVTASIRRVEEGGRGQMVEQNRNRSDRAAQELARLSTGATSNMANIDMGTGTAVSQGILNTANDNANATVANAGVTQGTLSAIGSIFADEQAKKARERRYGKVTEGV